MQISKDLQAKVADTLTYQRKVRKLEEDLANTEKHLMWLHESLVNLLEVEAGSSYFDLRFIVDGAMYKVVRGRLEIATEVLVDLTPNTSGEVSGHVSQPLSSGPDGLTILPTPPGTSITTGTP